MDDANHRRAGIDHDRSAAETERYEDLCKPAFGRIFQQLGEIKEALCGDVKGEKPGIQSRLGKLEDQAASRLKHQWLLLGAVVPLVVQAVWNLVARLVAP